MITDNCSTDMQLDHAARIARMEQQQEHQKEALHNLSKSIEKLTDAVISIRYWGVIFTLVMLLSNPQAELMFKSIIGVFGLF